MSGARSKSKTQKFAATGSAQPKPKAATASSSPQPEPEVAIANIIAHEFFSSKKTMTDLHGYSEKEAMKTVIATIKTAPTLGVSKLRFVTGRGNHINSKGERGTLYKNFKNWLTDLQTNASVEKVEQHDGFYEVEIKRDVPILNPFQAFISEQIKKMLADDIDAIKAGAAAGNFENLMQLAICYEQGIGVTQSYKNSTDCYLQIKDKKIR